MDDLLKLGRGGFGLGSLTLPLGKGGRFSLDAFMAGQSSGLYFDLTKTDRFFQENTGPTLADDVGEAIGLALGQRTWAGKALAELIASQPEQVTNGDMSSAAGWTLGNGWTITGGKAVRTNTGTSGYLTSNLVPVAGAMLRVAYTIDSVSGGQVVLDTPGSVGSARTSPGSYVDYVLPTSASYNLRFFAGAAVAAQIDNVSAVVIPGIHGVQPSGSLKPLRQSTGAKFDGSDDNWLTTYLAQSGANFIVALVTVPASLVAAQVIAGASGVAANRSFIAIDTSGRVCGGVGSDSTGTIVGTSDLRGLETVVGLSFDGTTVKLFAGTGEEYSAAQNSAPTTAIPYRIGGNNNNGTGGSYFGGSIKKLVAGREMLTLSKYQQIRNALLTA